MSSSPFFSSNPFSSSLRRPCTSSKRRVTPTADALNSSAMTTSSSTLPLTRRLTPTPAGMVRPNTADLKNTTMLPPKITTRSKREKMNCSICLDVISSTRATPDTCTPYSRMPSCFAHVHLTLACPLLFSHVHSLYLAITCLHSLALRRLPFLLFPLHLCLVSYQQRLSALQDQIFALAPCRPAGI
jgi:hypothetical protein